jgi:alkanesulfonate monooxygenase SsuD/methylene tetrahydromethanopterin reductase-like flavin-dependent oxidoreductase (luciferase family)
VGFGVLFTQGMTTGAPQVTLAEMLEQAEIADRNGFNAVLTTEHKYSEEYFGSPLPLSFAIAARTRHVRVGTAIAIAPVYNPVELAQDTAMLDQLSGGRAWLGIGAGYMDVDYTTVGVPWARRAQRFDETSRILKLAWTQDRFSFDDEVYTFEDISVIPKPLQAGGVPLHLAAWSPGGLRRAARLGDGWISNALMSLQTMRQLAIDYRAHAAALGRPSQVTAIRFCWPSHDRREADEKFGSTALSMARTLFDYGAITDLEGVTSAEQINLEDFVRDRFIFGTPEECIETIGRFKAEVGVDDFLMVFRYPTGPDHEFVRRAMELFAEEVAPAFEVSAP